MTVISVDSAVNSDNVAAYIGADNYGAGRMVAQSAPYTLAEWNQRSWLRKMCASLLRLVAIWF